MQGNVQQGSSQKLLESLVATVDAIKDSAPEVRMARSKHAGQKLAHALVDFLEGVERRTCRGCGTRGNHANGCTKGVAS